MSDIVNSYNDMVLAKSKSYVNPQEIKKVIGSRVTAYSQQIQDLRDLDAAPIEEKHERKVQAIQAIALDIATDLTTVSDWRLSNAGPTTERVVDPFVSYLRDLRSTVQLYSSMENSLGIQK